MGNTPVTHPSVGSPKNRTGHLFVVSAPSGAGKSTLCKALRKAFPDIQYAISHTTRKPRRGETDGVDYHFIDSNTFFNLRDQGCWAEWAEVHGHYYATSAEILDRALSEGRDILLEIDVQGTRQILAKYPDAVTIFIMAPSLEVLRERLLKRGTDDVQTIEKRLENAEKEIEARQIYRHVIVNDDLSKALERLLHIVETCRGDQAV